MGALEAARLPGQEPEEVAIPVATSESALHSALLAFQAGVPTLQKEAINPFFNSKYISLDSLMEQILPLLNGVGLTITQFPSAIVTGSTIVPALRTTITHAESGESMEDVSPLVLAKDDPQGQGSAITYMRRYALMAALGIVADVDDDANAASATPAKRATQVRGGSVVRSVSAAPEL